MAEYIKRAEIEQLRKELEWKDMVIELAERTAQAPRWIPVTERLPERTSPPHDVLVYHDLHCGMFIDRAWYNNEAKKWRSAVGMNLKVTHWMPLPEAPKEEKAMEERTDEGNA